jgi:hypothetical protein
MLRAIVGKDVWIDPEDAMVLCGRQLATSDGAADRALVDTQLFGRLTRGQGVRGRRVLSGVRSTTC